ncbi:MAG: hypothetical protein HYV52_03395 [Parcubacteria group bacterium]|nr:hypothetical protein [Parcubacteria group bacterium]
MEEYGLENPEQKQKKSLNELEKKILEFMNEPTHIDEIIKKGERSVNEIITSLVLMELNGYIKNIGGDIYMVI